MASSTRLVSETIGVTLLVKEDVDGVATLMDADATPTAVVCLYEQVVFTITASDVSHPSTGTYTFSFKPTEVGLHVVEWAWTYGGEDYTSPFKIEVTADPSGTVYDDSTGADEASEPDIGSSNTCTVTANFFDASGRGLQGVYVRFTPQRTIDSVLSIGLLAKDATAVSDEDGAISLVLVRKVQGTLSVSGLGIVRVVTIPDVAAISLQDLVALGDDLLEVQTPVFTSLPRRS